jgi:hypothetical protein
MAPPTHHQVPIEIILRIATFAMDFNTILSLRALSTELNALILTWLADDVPFNLAMGRRTMVKTDTCGVCGAKEKEEQIDQPSFSGLRQLVYPFMGDYNRLMIMHCRSWTCRLNALRSMHRDMGAHNTILLRKELPMSKQVLIPRSDGTRTVGMARRDHIYLIDNEYFVGTDWIESDMGFQKLVPVDRYCGEIELCRCFNYLLKTPAFSQPLHPFS